MQLLKAQYTHIFFNTLIIFILIRRIPQQLLHNLLMGLSDMLRYMFTNVINH